MFRHSLNIIWVFYVIRMRYVFKLIGFSPKGKPKKAKYFKLLLILDKKNNLFSCQCSSQLLLYRINIRSTVIKKSVFRIVYIVYFKELTRQNGQWVHRS